MTRLVWDGGGTAVVVTASADALVLVSTVPAPPGARIAGRLEPDPGEAEGPVLKVKVHGSRRQEDGSFRIEGRPLDLTRPVRARLERALAGDPGPEGAPPAP